MIVAADETLAGRCFPEEQMEALYWPEGKEPSASPGSITDG